MSIGQSFKRGFVLGNFANIYRTALQFGIGVYLARVIDPVFFGQSALIKAALGLLFAFMMFGTRHAILGQHEKILDYMAMQMAVRMIALGVIVIIAGLLTFFDLFSLSKELYLAFWLLVMSHVAVSITTIYFNYMQKNLLFGRMYMIQILSLTIASGLAVWLTFQGYKLWALIWLMAAEKFASAFLMTALVPQRFMPKMNWRMAGEFYHFGKYVFLSNIANRWRSQIDRMSIGYFVGEAELGFYGRAHSFVVIFQQLVNGPIQRAFSPIVGAIREDRQKVSIFLRMTLKTVIIISLGGLVLLAAIMPELVTLVYGEKWLPAAKIYRALLPCFIIIMVQTFILDFQLIDGSSKSVFISRIVAVLVLGGVIFPLMYWQGVIGAAIAADLALFAGLVVLGYTVKKTTGLRFSDVLFRPLLVTAIALSGSVFGVYFCEIMLWNTAALQFFVKTIVFSLIYVLGLFALEGEFIIRMFKLFIRKEEVLTI